VPSGRRSPSVSPKIQPEAQQKNGHEHEEKGSAVAHAEFGVASDHALLKHCILGPQLLGEWDCFAAYVRCLIRSTVV